MVNIDVNSFHSEKIKKKYTKMERDIKRKLTECLLRDHFWDSDFVCRGLSFTKDFELRGLEKDENNKHTINLANIKEDTIGKTRSLFEGEIIDLIERTVDENEVKKGYINGVKNFLNKYFHKNVAYLIKNKNYYDYISQYQSLHKSKNKQERMEFNIRSQIAKLMNEKFWDKAFVRKKENGKEFIEFSDLCSEYFYVLFCNANKVWTEWGKNLGQVFHDRDFPFIQSNKKKDMEKYLRVLLYLASKEKHNPYGKRDEIWNKERAKKTTQYADILRALTNSQLHIDELDYLVGNERIQSGYWSEISPLFEWDMTTNQIKKVGWWLLKWLVETHNQYDRKDKLPFEFTSRNKSLSSCVEKIIEGKKINDITGFRVSMQDVNWDHFEEIKKLSGDWIKALTSSFSQHPEKYVKKGQTLAIKTIQIDNKGVLNEKKQVWEFITMLKGLTDADVSKREKANPSFIGFDQWKEKMNGSYRDDVKDTENRDMYSAFFKQFSGGKARGVNGGYKDFKFNIVVGIYDNQWKEIGEKPIELQFDDINNGKGLANFNIRNIERRVNTQSNLTFNLSLWEVRKIVEESLKEMAEWAYGKNKKFSKINFWDGEDIDISGFDERTAKNSNEIDKAIVGIINYFLKKGTFFLYYKSDDKKGRPQDHIVLDKGLLTVKDLDSESLARIQICSAQEVGKQQYSYLWSKEDGYIGVYDSDAEKILRWKAGEVMDRMNLGKVKNAQYYL